MRFKGVYGNERYSLGSFFWSDIKKLMTIIQHSPFVLEDNVTDAWEFFRRKVGQRDTLFFSARVGKKVFGFCAFWGIIEGRTGVAQGWALRKHFRPVIECGKLLLDYGFNELGFKRISAVAALDNKPSLLLQNYLGFKKEGFHEDFLLMEGELRTAVTSRILVKEYYYGRSLRE